MSRLVGLGLIALVLTGASACVELKTGRCNHDSDCQSGFRCDLDPAPQGNGRCIPSNPGDGGDARPDGDAGVDRPTDAPAEKPDGTAACGVCGDMTPICDAVSKACRACSTGTECQAMSPTTPLCSATGACVECAMSGQCMTASKPVCDSATKACRACSSGTECQARNAATPTCAPSGACVECGASTQCTVGGKPICDGASGACRACSTGTECAARDPKAPACAATGSCVECVTSSDCMTPSKPVCATATNTCRACQADSECPADPGVCAPDGHCASSGEVIFVEFSAAGCPNADGSSSKPYCAPNDGVAALTSGRRVIVIRGAANTQMVLATTGVSPIVIGRKNGSGDVGSLPAIAGTALTMSSDTVLVRDLTLKLGAATSMSRGVLVQGLATGATLRHVTVSLGTGLGVEADAGTVLTMDGCLVQNNSQGGIVISGAKYDIQNSVIAGNAFGIQFSATTVTSGSQFRFNTIQETTASSCDPGNAQSLGESIVIGSNVSCVVANSITTAPTFSATKPFHLTGHLACPTAPATFPDHDIDGDPRLAPVDCGADQFVP